MDKCWHTFFLIRFRHHDQRLFSSTKFNNKQRLPMLIKSIGWPIFIHSIRRDFCFCYSSPPSKCSETPYRPYRTGLAQCPYLPAKFSFMAVHLLVFSLYNFLTSFRG